MKGGQTILISGVLSPLVLFIGALNILLGGIFGIIPVLFLIYCVYRRENPQKEWQSFEEKFWDEADATSKDPQLENKDPPSNDATSEASQPESSPQPKTKKEDVDQPTFLQRLAKLQGFCIFRCIRSLIPILFDH